MRTAVMGTAVIPLALSFTPHPLIGPIAGGLIVLAVFMLLAMLAP